MSEITIKDLIAWCDQRSSEDHEMKIFFWGGDPIFANLKLDSFHIENELEGSVYELLEEKMCPSYGMEYLEVSGNLIYDPATKAFSGLYIEDTGFELEFFVQGEIEMRVPRSTPFKFLEIGTNYDGEICAVYDGDVDNEEGVTAASVQESLTQFQPTLDKLNTDPDQLAVVAFDNDKISRTEFIEDGDDLVYVLKEIKLKKKRITRKKIEFDLVNYLS